MSVRSTLAAALAALATLAVASSIVLMVLTSRMHASATGLRGAAEAVELAGEAHLALVSVDAIAHEMAHGGEPELAPLRTERERALRAHLVALGEHVKPADRRRLLDDAVRESEAYLAAVSDGGHLPGSPADVAFEGARGGLEALARLSLEDARAAERSAACWNVFADALGIGAGIAALAAIAALIAWIRWRVLRPIAAIESAIASYGHGTRSARAEVSGPAELRTFAAAFNEMADGNERQRELQLAFVAAVAHDLRNPLTALEMAVARLRPDRPLPSEDRIRLTVEVVRKQVARLERLIEDFLDASRIEAGRFSLELADCDARDLAREAAELFADASPRHVVTLAPSLEALPVRCDPARMAQVLNNLVSNAIKYSPAGGRVEVAARRADGEVVLSVTDEGIGVTGEERERIFQPFRRGAAARDVPGAGLGLSTSRRIAEAHGGKIEVESRASGGSTFRVRLPAALPAADRAVTGVA